jgi:putative DNA primase/helicase
MSAHLETALAKNGISLRRYRLGEHRAACPACDRGPRDDALAVRLDDRGATWHCHRCGLAGGVRDGGVSVRAPTRQEHHPEPERRQMLAPWGYRLWAACPPIAPGTVAATYLERRGCVVPAGDLRWHPDLLDRVSCYRGPALVALVTEVETVEPLNLHRTWLKRDGSGKAEIEKPRRLLKGHRSRGVVRLWPDDEVTAGLVIGEGIETCLAAARSGLTPAWATLSAGNLAAFPVLPGIEGLTLLVDHDRPDKRGRRAGIEAALTVVRRYAGGGLDPEQDIKVILPPYEGQDAADLEVRP